MADRVMIEKNGRQRIHIELSKYRGHDLVDIRLWWLDEKTWRPSKKGMALQVSILPELRAALEKLEAEALKRGLLEAEDYQEAGLLVPEGV